MDTFARDVNKQVEWALDELLLCHDLEKVKTAICSFEGSFGLQPLILIDNELYILKCNNTVFAENFAGPKKIIQAEAFRYHKVHIKNAWQIWLQEKIASLNSPTHVPITSAPTYTLWTPAHAGVQPCTHTDQLVRHVKHYWHA